MRMDTKIKRLIRRYGVEGYGLYNYMIECIAFNLSPDSPIPDLEDTAQDIAADLKMDTLRVEEIIKYCIEQELFAFHSDTKRVMCLKLLTHLDNHLSRNPEIKQILANFDQLRSSYVGTTKEQQSECEATTKKLKADKIRSDKTRVDKNINNIKPTTKLAVKKDSLHTTIQLSFEAINGVFDNYAIEGKAIKSLISKAKKNNPDNPELFIRNMLDAFKTLRETDTKDYWSNMPFLPSRLNSNGIWTNVKQIMQNKKNDIDEGDKLEKLCEGVF